MDFNSLTFRVQGFRAAARLGVRLSRHALNVRAVSRGRTAIRREVHHLHRAMLALQAVGELDLKLGDPAPFL